MIANGAGSPSETTDNDLDNYYSVLYSKGYSPQGFTQLNRGLPSDGVINSDNLQGATYKLEDYSGKNAVVLNSQGESGKLTFNTPGAYRSLAILSSSGNGPSILDTTLNFSDGSSTAQTFNVPDWYAGTNYAIKGTGRVYRNGSTVDNTTENPRLYDNIINLKTEDQSKFVKSITFNKTSTSGKACIFAISGVASQGVPSIQQATAVEILRDQNILTAQLKNDDGSQFTTTASVTYEWCREGNLVDGNYNHTYEITNEDKGKNITVKAIEYDLTSEPFHVEEDNIPVTTPAAVVLSRGSLGSAGNQSITGLTTGSKYKVIVDGVTKYVKADGTLSTLESDIANLSGTVITGLTNGTTYNVQVYGPKIEQIIVDVTSGAGDGAISQTVIQRTTEENGTKKDDVTYTPDKVQETVNALKNQGRDIARILVPDAKDEVSEAKVNIPTSSIHLLAGGNINLQIETENVQINLPKESLINLSQSGNEDLYFRIVPIKEVSKQDEIKARANKEEIVKKVVGNNSVEVVGRPMTIEANVRQQSVDLILPLQGVTIPTNPTEREVFLKSLAIFIEHSDGEKVLQRGEIVEYKTGVLGIKFRINKFSTFTIVKVNQVQTNQTTGYVTPNYVAGTVVSTSSSSSSNSSSNDKTAKENVQTTTNNNSTASAEGWNQNSKDWKYIKNGQPVTGWNQIDGAWYLMDSTGTMQVGWKQENGAWYLLKNDGAMATGWQQVEGQWYFLKGNGAMAKDWIQSNGIWYLLKDNGAMAIGWQQSNGEWYYLYSDGAMASNTIIDGYPLNENGAWSNQ